MDKNEHEKLIDANSKFDQNVILPQKVLEKENKEDINED